MAKYLIKLSLEANRLKKAKFVKSGLEKANLANLSSRAGFHPSPVRGRLTIYIYIYIGLA